MIRVAGTILLGWLLMAAVAGLGHSVGLTVMLPATSAVLLARTAFAREVSVAAGMFIAVALGYLEDVHQGTPIGVLCLAYALAYLLMMWAATRLAVEGPIVRAFAAGLLAVVIDLLTFAVLMAFAEPFGVAPRTLLNALPAVRWHALATFLAAPAVWWLADVVMRRPSPSRSAYTPVTWYRS